MDESEESDKPLAVQLAEAGVEDADAIAAAVKADADSSSAGIGDFLSNTSPGELADAAGSLLSVFGGTTEQQPARQPASEPPRTATDGGDEIEGSPLRQEGREEMEESDEDDETEVNDEGQ
jgi:hypothetical protein